MKERIPVAVLAATGSVGQRFISLLDGHPWFEVKWVTGSDRTAGSPYGEACEWILPEPMPGWARELILLPSDPDVVNAPLVFSALPATSAQDIEPQFAQAGMVVCSNASAYRTARDVPILMPEVNADHLDLLPIQRINRAWSGAIVTNSNCTSAGLTVALKAMLDAFGVYRAIVVSMQALSGAGYPGVPSLNMLDNVVPYIAGEEEKVEWEPRKMLGKLENGEINLADLQLSVHANRVAVRDGHMVCLSVELSDSPTLEDVAEALTTYQPPEASRGLPSTPEPVILLHSEPDRPQPLLDRMSGRGMTTLVGRLRPDPVFDYRMVILSHNTIRGAAGGSVYNAELMVAKGLIS